MFYKHKILIFGEIYNCGGDLLKAKIKKYILYIPIVFLLLCGLVFSLILIPSEESLFPKTSSISSSEFVSSIFKGQVQKYEFLLSQFCAEKDDNSLTVNTNHYNNSRKTVIAGGELIGLKLKTKGVVIVGTEKFECENGMADPSAEAGILVGDIIVSIDGQEVYNNIELSTIIENSAGKTLNFNILRNGNSLCLNFTPVKSSLTGLYKGGLWVRDSTGGIGTLTYTDLESGTIATLGHGIYDVDTKELLPVDSGEVYSAKLNGVKKGTGGTAGELIGSIGSENYGEITVNCENGVYADSYYIAHSDDVYPVAYPEEITTGKAQIISTVAGNTKKYYDIEIKKIDTDSDNKNLIVEVTDDELLDITGGIVQGMSGSPIIQNDMIVGAVTHVFLNDPTKGYGIIIENMLEAAK